MRMLSGKGSWLLASYRAASRSNAARRAAMSPSKLKDNNSSKSPACLTKDAGSFKFTKVRQLSRPFAWPAFTTLVNAASLQSITSI